MNKKQRIRYDVAAAYRANAAASTERHDDLQIVRNAYDLSTGMQKAYAIFSCGPSSSMSQRICPSSSAMSPSFVPDR